MIDTCYDSLKGALNFFWGCSSQRLMARPRIKPNLKPRYTLTYRGCRHLSCVLAVSCRQMCGVHYRMDSEEGLLLGEIVGVRMLQQVR